MHKFTKKLYVKNFQSLDLEEALLSRVTAGAKRRAWLDSRLRGHCT
jgi:hypothetical protein